MQGPAPGGRRGLSKGGGRGRKSGIGLGPSGVCICTNPNCGYTVSHQGSISPDPPFLMVYLVSCRNYQKHVNWFFRVWI